MFTQSTIDYHSLLGGKPFGPSKVNVTSSPDITSPCTNAYIYLSVAVDKPIAGHTISWAQTKGYPVTLIDANTLTPFFQPYTSSGDKDYQFVLTIDAGTRSQTTVVVNVYRVPTELMSTIISTSSAQPAPISKDGALAPQSVETFCVKRYDLPSTPVQHTVRWSTSVFGYTTPPLPSDRTTLWWQYAVLNRWDGTGAYQKQLQTSVWDAVIDPNTPYQVGFGYRLGWDLRKIEQFDPNILLSPSSLETTPHAVIASSVASLPSVGYSAIPLTSVVSKTTAFAADLGETRHRDVINTSLSPILATTIAKTIAFVRDSDSSSCVAVISPPKNTLPVQAYNVTRVGGTSIGG